MDISFYTNAGGNAWSLEECARWARQNDFDAIRLGASGVADPDTVLQKGPSEINDTLKAQGLYLAALSAHSNLLRTGTYPSGRPTWPRRSTTRKQTWS